ncbi:uncharacterized protein [Dendropsophus ebraccatus]|uniref:uncharacterized protein n=1 Tax=Dendropsophus ebraccatus TaxID=150705 RepID=UPI0038316A75
MRSGGKRAAKAPKIAPPPVPERPRRRVSAAVRASASRGAHAAGTAGNAASAASERPEAAASQPLGVPAAAATGVVMCVSQSPTVAAGPSAPMAGSAAAVSSPPPPPPPSRLARWFWRGSQVSTSAAPPPAVTAPPADSSVGSEGQDSSGGEFFDAEPSNAPGRSPVLRAPSASHASRASGRGRGRRRRRRGGYSPSSLSSYSSDSSDSTAGRKRRRRTSHVSNAGRHGSACREAEEYRRHRKRYHRSPRSRRHSSPSGSSPDGSRSRCASHRRVRGRGSSRRSSRESRLERSSATRSELAPPTSSAPQPSRVTQSSAPLRSADVGSFQDAAPPSSDGRSPLPAFPMGLGEPLRPLLESSLSTATWSNHGQHRPEVWIIGHSFIHRAAQRASCRPGGLNLGFSQANVSWRGVGGMRWLRVLSEVIAISKQLHGPAVLVIHAGGNDLCSVRLAELISVIKSDVIRMSELFTDSIIVWSEVVPRVVWNGARNPGAIERARRILNTRISRFVRSRGGIAIAIASWRATIAG